MKSKQNKSIIETIHVVSKKNKVFIKSNTESNKWHSINFQWIPVFELNKTMNH
ncbi:hypothetical protein [uncultured Algibacter sp.]|uniref:hypothetical protein n=1 Tax=uncultured Algibacter sp. TaxID=298659 RepID=UPI00260E640A|nr:hypothetical protein [uncultured Algibacter sp.]